MTDAVNSRNLSVWAKLTRWARVSWEAIQPSDRVRDGVAWAMAALVALVAAILGASLKVGYSPSVDFVLGTLLALVLAALSVVVAAAVTWLGRPVALLFTRRAVLLVAGAIGASIAVVPELVVLAAPIFVLLVVVGAIIGAASRGGFRQASPAKRAVIVTSGSVVSVAVVAIVIWLASTGNDAHLVAYRPDPVAIEPIDAPDPSQPGPSTVATLTYGSGSDRQRAEFGDGVTLTTEPVDASKLVKGSEGWRMKLRHHYWGFDFEHFPVNGRVWYPEGDGPFPLVLCVHGNHSMEEFSDPGYAYLGELLASRGFIFVSVDENFFNGSWRGSLTTENDGRGWMLLEHLRVWRDWNRSAGNPFSGRVAMDRIALIGHSRGGEAAAIAGAFNRLSRYPDDASLEFDFGFGIRSIVSIAPSDGQYEPADQPTPLENVNYLLLQGAHDSDVAVFMGIRQYRRVAFTDDGSRFGHRFKASVYSYRSNHGQFNTVWGDTDHGFPVSPLINRRPLLDGEAQRRIALVYISGFLEATLNDRTEYLGMFRDHRTIRHWLPEDLYITRFQDSTFRGLASYEDDVNVTTGDVEGVRLEGTGLAVWREEHQSCRKFISKRNGMAVLGWRADDDVAPTDDTPPARYSIHLSRDVAANLQVTGESLLLFSMADTGEQPPSPDEEEGDSDDEQKTEDDGEKEPLDLSLELASTEGVTSRISLSEVRAIPIPLESRLTKLPFENALFGPAWEPTLQTFEVPMSAFMSATPEFEPSELATIAFIFDQTDEGLVFLDDVGFARPVDPTSAAPGADTHAR